MMGMSFFNGQNLQLETENPKTDFRIFTRLTVLGFENKKFVISDF